MKKLLLTYAKKSMSLFMACIMLLTCWVFVAPTEAEAASVASYNISVTVNLLNGTPSGHIVVYYKEVGADGTLGEQQETNLIERWSDHVEGAKQGLELEKTIQGWPCGIRIIAQGDTGGCESVDYVAQLKKITVGEKTIIDYGTEKVSVDKNSGEEGKTFMAGTTGGNWGDNFSPDWPEPAAKSITGMSNVTLNLDQTGTKNTVQTAKITDNYNVTWNTAPTYTLSNSTNVTKAVSGNGYSITAGVNALVAANGYNASTGKVAMTLKAASGSASQSVTITLQSPTYTVGFDDACETVHNKTCYYNGSVTAPTTPCEKAPDNNYHYAFTGWNDTIFTNITANKTIEANYSKTAHEFKGEWVYNGDGTHSKKCTGCEVVGYDDKAYADGGYLECTGTWTGSDSSHSMSCTTCNGTPSHAPSWHEDTNVKYRVTEQSCTTDGVYKKSCSICGLAHSTETFISGKATGHDYSMKGETKSHTCTENGYVIYWCSCGEFINDEYKRNDDGTYVYENGEKVLLDPAAHSWSSNISNNAAEGKHGIKCEKCDEWKELTDHNWTLQDTDIIKAPTCHEAGEGLYRCSCGATKTDTIAIDPNAHSYSSAVSNNDGTHTAVCENGCGQDVKDPCVDEDSNCECDVCGYKFEHKYANIVKADNLVSAADCNSYAVYYKSCSVCGLVSSETFEDVNGGYGAHNWDDTETFLKSEAKCEIDAVYYYECLECGESSEEVDGATWTKAGTALGHEATDVLISTTDGKHAYKCVRYDDCGKTLNETDCTYENYNDNNDGTHTGTCACGDTFTEDHKMTDWESDNKEGAVAGTQSRHCEVCDYAENEQTCTYVEDESKYVAPTCMTVGGRTYICSDCGHGYSIVLEKNPDNHTGNNHFENAVVPTCNATGYEGDIICECGVKVGTGETLEEDPNNHGENGTTVVGAVTATCTIEGHTGKITCLGCNAVITEDVNLGLEPDNHVAKTAHDGLAATCEADGYTAYETCDACHKELGKEVLTKLGHEYNGEAVVLDGDVHAYKCERFEECASTGVGTEKDATEACSGGEASCTELAKCSVCGDTWGELAAHQFTGDYAQYTIDGVEYHNQKCANCDAYGLGSEKDAKVACSGGEATCTEKAACDICGMEYGAALGHDFTGDVVELENNKHTYKCIRCDVTGTVADGEGGTEACVDSEPEVIAPTCTEDGYTQHECDICDNEWTTNPVVALGHDYTEKLIDDAHKISDADCVTDEVYWYDCSRCDKNAKDETDTEKYTELTFINTPAYGHKFDGDTEFLYKATDATCTAHETYYVYCSVCKESSKDTDEEETFIKYGTMLPHTYAELVDEEDLSKNRKSEATCTEAAVYYKSCSVCGAQSTETFTYGEVKGHVFTEKIMDAAHRITTANCETAATYWFDCANCNQNAALIDQSEMTEDEIAALKYTDGDKAPNTHTSLKDIPFRAATCTVDGHGAYQYCEGCEAEIDKETVGYEAKGHDFNGAINHVAETDTHNFKCLNCDAYGIGKGVKEEGENKTIACTFGDWAHVEGTLTHSQSCDCGNKKTDDCEDSTPTVVAPTCTADGYTAHECDVCGYEWTTDPTNKLEHAYPEKWTSNGDGTHSKICANNCGEDITEDCSGGEATCSEKAVCDVCEGEYGETTDHKFETYAPGAPAQCGVNAKEKAKCEYCDATDEREIAGTALKHEMGDYVVTKEPTCMAEGEETSYCQNTWIIDGKEVKCTHSTTRVIPADSSAHVTGEWITDTGAGDCLSGIRYYKICEVCKEVVEEKTETGNHDWKVKVDNKPTCISDGYILYECSVCHAPKREYPDGYEALGHDWGEEIIVKAASCANEGRAYQLCERCGKKGDDYRLAKLAHGPKFDEAGKLLNPTEVIIVDPVSATCATKGHNGYWKCLNCSYDEHLDPNSAYEEYPTIAHTDSNNDGNCDTCGGKIYNDGDSSGSCKCICHKNNWFMQIFYKIFRLFWKLFRINQTCDCGFVHY